MENSHSTNNERAIRTQGRRGGNIVSRLRHEIVKKLPESVISEARNRSRKSMGVSDE